MKKLTLRQALNAVKRGEAVSYNVGHKLVRADAQFIIENFEVFTFYTTIFHTK